MSDPCAFAIRRQEPVRRDLDGTTHSPAAHAPARPTTVAAGLVQQLQEGLLDLRLSPNVPEAVTHHVCNARDLIVAGFFSYELASLAIESAARAAERALRELFVCQLKPPVTFVHTKRSGRAPETLQYRPTVETVFECFLAHRAHIDGFDREFHGTFGQLTEWAIASGLIPAAEQSWWDAIQFQRNQLAHGNTLVVTPNLPLAFVRESAWKINALFPDVETSEHDRQVRAKPRPILEVFKYG